MMTVTVELDEQTAAVVQAIAEGEHPESLDRMKRSACEQERIPETYRR